MKIRAAIVPGIAQPFRIEDVELDDPRPDEILVRNTGTGVCHSDVVFKDNMPLTIPSVLGHEGAGIVVKTGKDVTAIQPGDHVVLSYNYCGKCVKCLTGKPYYCESHMMMNYSGIRPDGSRTMNINGSPVHGSFFAQSSFADYSLAMEKNAVKVPDDIPLEILGPLGCGIQTGAGAVMNSLTISAGSSIAVFGLGTVGLSAIMAAKVIGCTTIIGVDVNPSRLDIAIDCGATHVINSKKVNPTMQVHSITKTGADYSIECSGIPDVYQQAFAALNPNGTCVLLGVAPMGSQASFDMSLMLMGRTTKGVIEGESVPQNFIPKMIEMFRQGIFPFNKLIKFYTLKDINKAVEDSKNGLTIKPVILFN